MGEVATGDGVEATEKGAADAPAEAVIDTYLILADIFIARQSHGSSLSTLLTAKS